MIIINLAFAHLGAWYSGYTLEEVKKGLLVYKVTLDDAWKSLHNNFHPAKQFWAGTSTDAACQNGFACHSSTITSTYSVSPYGNNHELTCCSVSNEFLWNVPDCLISQCGGHWRIPLSMVLCCQCCCATLCQGRDLITIYQSHWVHIRLIWWESSQTQPYIFDQRSGLYSPLLLFAGILIPASASSVKWTGQDSPEIWRPFGEPHVDASRDCFWTVLCAGLCKIWYWRIGSF